MGLATARVLRVCFGLVGCATLPSYVGCVAAAVFNETDTPDVRWCGRCGAAVIFNKPDDRAPE